MAFVFRNPNPKHNITSDCVIRAIAIFFDITWDEAFVKLSAVAFDLKNIMEANYVWGEFLLRQGLVRRQIPNECPNCYTVKNFCDDHKNGSYILATGTHVVTVVDGDYYDTWDSGDEVPVYYWTWKET